MTCLKHLYHSEGKPSEPGILFPFKLDIVLLISCSVICRVSALFCSVPTEGKSNEFKKCSTVF